jgi:hypothetical protein
MQFSQKAAFKAPPFKKGGPGGICFSPFKPIATSNTPTKPAKKKQGIFEAQLLFFSKLPLNSRMREFRGFMLLRSGNTLCAPGFDVMFITPAAPALTRNQKP